MRRGQEEVKRRLERIESFPIYNQISRPNTDPVYPREIDAENLSAARSALGPPSSLAGSNPDKLSALTGLSFAQRASRPTDAPHLRRSERLRIRQMPDFKRF